MCYILRTGNQTCIFNTDACEITLETRNDCRSCRYNKCIAVGMMPEKVKGSSYNKGIFYIAKLLYNLKRPSFRYAATFKGKRFFLNC